MTTGTSSVRQDVSENSSTSTSQQSNLSSVGATANNVQSTTNSPEIDFIIKHINTVQKPPTPSQIKANGEVKLAEAEAIKIEIDAKNKRIVLFIIGIISILLTLFGCFMFVFSPDNAQNVWVIIGPIIIACTSGTIGFLTGEKQSASKE